MAVFKQKTDQIVETARKYIEENYQMKITRKEICDLTYTSPSYFYNLFKQNTGYSLLEYIASIRINKAKEMLARSDMKVYEVALTVGYDDFRYFSKVFKKLVNVNPTEYRDYLKKM
jgi:two-component system response regulator YesN